MHINTIEVLRYITMSRPDNIVQSLIQHGLIQSTDEIRIKPLTGGYHNYVYRLQSGEYIDWVVKQYVTQSSVPLFPVLPDHEAGALRMFQGAGVAPEFIEFLPDALDGPIVVYEYIHGELWKDDVVSVAKLLNKTHNTPLSGSFRYLKVWPKELIESSRSILAEMENGHEGENLLGDYLTDHEYDGAIVHCLVHTDCGPGNIVVGGNGPRLIDWQCPGLGDAVEDLVNFTSPAIQILYGLPPLTRKQRHNFFDAYDDPAVKSRFDHIGNYYRVRFVAYCLYREESLRQSDPETSQLYRRALDAEINLIKSLAAL